MRRERDSPPPRPETSVPGCRRIAETHHVRVCRTTAEPGGFGQTAPSERRAPVGCRRDRQGQEAYDDDAAPAPRPVRRRENSGRRSPLERPLLRKASGPVDFPNVPPCRSVSSLLPGSRTHPPHTAPPREVFPRIRGKSSRATNPEVSPNDGPGGNRGKLLPGRVLGGRQGLGRKHVGHGDWRFRCVKLVLTPVSVHAVQPKITPLDGASPGRQQSLVGLVIQLHLLPPGSCGLLLSPT